MGEPAYRAMPMPMPPGPRRDWRRIIARGLGVFNALVLGAALLHAMTERSNDAFIVFVLISALAILAVIGSVVPMPRSRRSFLVLPSAAVWLVLGVLLVFGPFLVAGHVGRALAHDHPDWSPTQLAIPFLVPSAVGLLFLLAGALSIKLYR
jgi:hypothetical protein